MSFLRNFVLLLLQVGLFEVPALKKKVREQKAVLAALRFTTLLNMSEGISANDSDTLELLRQELSITKEKLKKGKKQWLYDEEKHSELYTRLEERLAEATSTEENLKTCLKEKEACLKEYTKLNDRFEQCKNDMKISAREKATLKRDVEDKDDEIKVLKEAVESKQEKIKACDDTLEMTEVNLNTFLKEKETCMKDYTQLKVMFEQCKKEKSTSKNDMKISARENETLKNDIKDREKEIKELKEDVKSEQEKNTTCCITLKTTEDNLNICLKEKEACLKDYTQLKVMFEQGKKDLSAYQDGMNITAREVAECNKEIESSKKTIDELQNDLTNKNDKISTLKKELSESELELTKNKQTSENTVEEYKQDIRKYTAETEGCRKHLDDVLMENEKLTIQSENLERELNTLNKTLAKCDAAFNECTKQKDDIEGKAAVLEEKVIQYEIELQECEIRKNEVDNCTKQIDDLIIKCKELELTIKEGKEKLRQCINDSKLEQEEIESKCNQYLDSQKEKMDASEERIRNDYERKLTGLRRDCIDLQNALSENNNIEKSKADKTESALESIKMELKTCQDLQTTLRENFNNENSKAGKAESALESMKLEVQKCQETERTIRENVNNEKSKVEKAESGLESTMSELKKCHDDLERAAKEKDQEHDKLTECAKEKEQLDAKFRELEKRLKNCEHQLEVETREHAKWKLKYVQCKNTLNESKRKQQT